MIEDTNVRRGVIYFLTDGEAVKIGFTEKLNKRVKQLQTSHYFPLFLLGSIPAAQCEERLIHNRFAHLRMSGEWFRVAPELTDFIDGHEAAGTLIPGEQMKNYQAKVAALDNK